MHKVFFEIFESLPRQGPGDEESIKKAFHKLADLPPSPDILDVGCGSGGQTMVLAELTSGRITAIDNHAPFIEKLNHNARQLGYVDRIHSVVGDMAAMNFEKNSFDIIWSEGAANLMGISNALTAWRPLLRPSGYMAISELVWFGEEIPLEIKEYFAQAYPDMKYYKHIFKVIESSGYKLIDYFPLPSETWWTHYYTPAEKRLVELREKYQDNTDAQAIFDSFQLEIDMYRKYSEHYGYGFYIMQRA